MRGRVRFHGSKPKGFVQAALRMTGLEFATFVYCSWLLTLARTIGRSESTSIEASSKPLIKRRLGAPGFHYILRNEQRWQRI